MSGRKTRSRANRLCSPFRTPHVHRQANISAPATINAPFSKPWKSIGATDLNGTTSEDRPIFLKCPQNALDVALWMESDRMGHLLAAVDQTKLDEQRGSSNKKRQGENQPYGAVEELNRQGNRSAAHPIPGRHRLDGRSQRRFLDDVRAVSKLITGGPTLFSSSRRRRYV